jgi:hypothetical protein
MLPAWLSKMSEGNSELACRQFVAWVDFRRDEKGGEEWWQAQAPALQKAYVTAQIALREAKVTSDTKRLFVDVPLLVRQVEALSVVAQKPMLAGVWQMAGEICDLLQAGKTVLLVDRRRQRHLERRKT